MPTRLVMLALPLVLAPAVLPWVVIVTVQLALAATLIPAS